MSPRRPTVSPSCPSAVEEGAFLFFFTSCQAVVWLPVVLFLSPSSRGTPLLFLVYRILMI